MIWVTETISSNKIAINTRHVVAVFIISDGEHKGKTAISLTNGNIVVDESDYDVAAMVSNG